MATGAVAIRSEARERPFFQASRSLSMGDAYTAYNDGFEAVYYNPAGIARRNKAKAKIFDLEALGSYATYQYLRGTVTSFGSFSKITDQVTANPGKVHTLGISLLPQFLVRNFSIGLVTRAYTEAYTSGSALDLNLYAYTDAALYMHYAAALFGGIVKIGVGLKALNRAEIDKTYTAAEYASGSLSLANQWREGLGYGVDVGLMATIPWPTLPTLGIAVLDAGNTKLAAQKILWSGSQGSGRAPQDLKQKVNVGYSMSFKHAPGTKSVLAVDVKDVLNIDTELQEQVHAGYELGIRESFYLRGGVNQGRYWTAGLGIHVGGVAIEVSSYGENLRLGSGSRKDDRKYVARYLIGF